VDFSRDYYEIMGLENTASSEDIKKAYRELAKKYHPDINKSSTSEELFKLISEAYEVLSDEARRTQYDLYRKFELESELKEESSKSRTSGKGSPKQAARPSETIQTNGMTEYKERPPSKPVSHVDSVDRTQLLALSIVIPGYYQISIGEKKFGYMLFGVYFIFWVLAFFQSMAIGILALLILIYSAYEAYSHSSGKARP
jgi:curved DNA-binding protein CbpA